MRVSVNWVGQMGDNVRVNVNGMWHIGEDSYESQCEVGWSRQVVKAMEEREVEIVMRVTVNRMMKIGGHSYERSRK